jgi:hypothetical protein
MSSVRKCFSRALYVLFGGPAKGSYFDVAAAGCDGANGGEVTFGRDWKAGLDDVNAEILELFGHTDLFAQVHRTAGRLLAVA